MMVANHAETCVMYHSRSVQYPLKAAVVGVAYNIYSYIHSYVHNKYIHIHTYTFLECRVVLNIQQCGLVGDEGTGIESIRSCCDRAKNPA